MAYFSNGSEGEILDVQCSECMLSDDAQCPILFVQMTFNYDQNGNEHLKKAMEMLVSKKGRCEMKPLLDNLGVVNTGKKCFQRPLVFGDEEQIEEINKVTNKP